MEVTADDFMAVYEKNIARDVTERYAYTCTELLLRDGKPEGALEERVNAARPGDRSYTRRFLSTFVYDAELRLFFPISRRCRDAHVDLPAADVTKSTRNDTECCCRCYFCGEKISKLRKESGADCFSCAWCARPVHRYDETATCRICGEKHAHVWEGSAICRGCGEVCGHQSRYQCQCTICQMTVHSPDDHCICRDCGAEVHGEIVDCTCTVCGIEAHDRRPGLLACIACGKT